MTSRASQRIERRADARPLGRGRRATTGRLTRGGRVGFLVWAVLAGAGCQAPLPAPHRPPETETRRPTPVVIRPTRHDPLHRFQPAELPQPAGETERGCGSSRQGERITMKVFGTVGPTVFIFGGIHGNEPTSALLAHRLIDYLRAHPEAYRFCRVALLPEANPDGLALGTRGNVRGVDINRNFPASNYPANGHPSSVHGPYAASEPETRAIMEAVRQVRPARIVSIHSIRRGRHGNNYDGSARALAEQMSRHNGYPVLPTMGYPTPGSFGNWAGVDQRIPTITLELPADNNAETCWQENREALLAVIGFAAVPSDGRLAERPMWSRAGPGK